MILNFACNSTTTTGRAAGALGREGGTGAGASGGKERRKPSALEGQGFKLYGATVTMPEPEDRVQVRPGRGTRPRGTRARGTRQAQALAAALAGLPGFYSAQEIHAELRRKGEHVGLATVYRHLQALSEQGSVDAIRDANGEILYRQCGTSVHHHHLTCRNCGRSVEVEGRAVEHWAERVAAEAGFTKVDHTVELFGLCPECAG
jgi:Fur family transcriptional regulator, ferric uptake regulator